MAAEPVRPPGKIGPNSPCWCGSGRKYKKCHRAADEEASRSQPAGQVEPGGSRCRHGHEPCYPYLPQAGSHRAAGRLEFTEAVRRMVHSGTRVFHFFDPEDLGAGAEEYGQVIDKLRSYGITPYLDGDPSSAELELGQRWLDCLFGPGAYELRASGQRFDAAKHAVWIEGVAAEGGVPVYWGWDPSFARVVAQVVEWRWQWGGPDVAAVKNIALDRRHAPLRRQPVGLRSGLAAGAGQASRAGGPSRSRGESRRRCR